MGFGVQEANSGPLRLAFLFTRSNWVARLPVEDLAPRTPYPDVGFGGPWLHGMLMAFREWLRDL